LHDLHAAVAELPIEMTGTRVERLVVVLVGVDRTEGQIHAAAPSRVRCHAPRGPSRKVITFRPPAALPAAVSGGAVRRRCGLGRAHGAAASAGGRASSPAPAAR